ncbi:MAG TPA: hypothetical protein VGL48_06850 [Acidimicrobiales bacterium]
MIDQRGKILDTAEFKATAKGYRLLAEWMRGYGGLAKVGGLKRPGFDGDSAALDYAAELASSKRR